MLGKTHVPVGITTALIATHPTTVSGVIGAVAGGALGGWICDIDVRDSSEKDGRIVGFIIMAIDVGAALAIDFILGNGICDYVLHSLGYLNILAAVLFCAGCFYGIATSHRTFMHSILALVLFSGLMFFFCKPLWIPFAAGYMSHILLDLFNRRGMQLLFPIKARISFDVCDSDGDANRIIGGVAVVASIVLTVILGVNALQNEGMAFRLLDTSRQNSPVFSLSLFELYLIVINVITFIAYVIDFLICYNGIVSEDNEDMLHNFLNLFAFAGGGLGALIALLLLTKKGRANAYWFVKIIAILLAWSVLYLVVANPFEIEGATVKSGIIPHLPLAIYLLSINIITIVFFVRDRYKRRSDMNASELLLIVLCFIGGAVGGYLVMILTNGKKHLPHFALGLPLMIAVQALIIAYLVFSGIT